MKNPRFLPRLAAGLFTLTAGALPPLLTVLPLTPAAARAAEAPAGEVSFDLFYNNLADNGDWYNTPDFGYVFQPYIAFKNEGWRPYTDGYWAQTDQGWTWVSYEDFGWACYHYGRWSQLENVGWVWVPGYEWGPGWVSWRTSDDYIGWAPLPPKATTRQVAVTTVERTGGNRVIEEESRSGNGRVYEGRLIRPEDVEEDYDAGYNAGVDVRYDIGPAQYSFVPVQNFGAPYLAEAVVPLSQNVVILENTTNVTNISYRRGHRDDRVIYCGGPDYAFVSRRAERPIPRLLLERRTDVGPDHGVARADRFNVVRDNRLEFFAPLVARRAVDPAQFRPVRVKENLERPQIIHGWRNAQQQDPRMADRLRERFQQQARQAPPARQVVENFVTPAAFRAQPPPTIQEQQRQHQPPPPRTREGNTPPTVGAVPAAAVPPPGPGARPAQGPPPNPAAAVQPVPGPGGRNLNDAERQARRDARQRELEQRQGKPQSAPPPGSPPAPPNVVNQGNPTTPPPPAPAAAPGQPPRPNRTAEEREAYRAAKQAEQARERATARPPGGQVPPETPNPAGRAPAQPFQGAPPNNAPERPQEENRGPRVREPQAAQPQPDAAREQRRAARAQEEQSQRAAQQLQQAQAQQQKEAAREQRRAAQQPQQQAAERPPAQPRPGADREQQREQRRAERQPQAEPAPQQARAEAAARAQQAQQQQQGQAQRQAAEGRRAPEARPQPAQATQNSEEERKKKHGEN